MRYGSLLLVGLLLLSGFGSGGEEIESPIEISMNSSIPYPVYLGNRTPHAPIYIGNDTSLKEQIISEGWSGNGTAGNPYVIEDLVINANGTSYCIIVYNVDLYLLIRNCTFYNATDFSTDGKGVIISDSSNIVIQRCEIYNNTYGISIWDSDCRVDKCNIYNNSNKGAFLSGPYAGVTKISNSSIFKNPVGIYCFEGSTEIISNEIYSNDNEGIFLRYEDGFSRIEGNEIHENEYGIYANHPCMVDSNTIYDSTNTGILIAINGIMNSTIRRNHIEGGEKGIHIYTNYRDSTLIKDKSCISDNQLRNCSISGIDIGISYLIEDDSINVQNNRLKNCDVDLFFYHTSSETYINFTSNNTINNLPVVYLDSRNVNDSIKMDTDIGQLLLSFVNNCQIDLQGVLFGITANYCENITFRNGEVCGIDKGMKFRGCIHVTIVSCSIRSGGDGIYAFMSERILAVNNTLESEEHGISTISTDLRLYGNNFINCSISVFLWDLYYHTNPIPMNNTVNGKPVYLDYNRDRSGKNLTGDFGQILLFKVNGLRICDMILENGSIGIISYSCTNNKYENLVIANFSDCGIKESGHSSFINLTISGNHNGINSYYSIDISRSSFISNHVALSVAPNAHYNVIGLNLFIGNQFGIIKLNYSGYNEIIVKNNLFYRNIINTDLKFAVYYNNTFLSGNGSMCHFCKTSYSSWSKDKIGNYWEGNNGSDEDGDGICDEPLVIDEIFNMTDDYPLMRSPHFPDPDLFVTNGKHDIKLTWDPPVETSFFIPEGISLEKRDPDDKVESIPLDLDYVYYIDTDFSDPGSYSYRLIINGRIPGTEVVTDYVKTPWINGTVDWVPPTIEIISPEEGSIVGEMYVEIRWNASDIGGGIDNYYIKSDSGDFISTDFKDQVGWTKRLESGEHTVVVRAMDVLGNFAEAKVNFTVDLEMPELEMIYPLPGSLLMDDDIEMRWSGIDRGEPISKYDLQVDGKTIFRGKNRTSHYFVEMEYGYHEVDIIGYDTAGNLNHLHSDFFLDNKKPFLELHNPDGAYYSMEEMRVSWKCNDHDREFFRCHIALDDGEYIPVGSRTNYTMIITREGDHEIRVKAVDEAGNVVVDVFSFTLDLNPPEVTIYSPLDGSHHNTRDLEVSLIAVDRISSPHKIFYMVDGEGWYDISYREAFIIENLREGNRTINIRVSDIWNHFFETTIEIVIDLHKPEVDLIWPRTDIEPDWVIYIEFTEPMNPESLEIDVAGTEIDYNYVDGKLMFRFMDDFIYNNIYEIRVNGGEDLAGNKLDRGIYTIHTVDKCWIDGSVFSLDGLPVEGAMVYLDGVYVNDTDEDGRFMITAISGPHTLEIREYSIGKHTREITVEPGEEYAIGKIFLGEPVDEEDEGGGISGEGRAVFIIIIGILMLVIGIEIFVVMRKRKRFDYFEE